MKQHVYMPLVQILSKRMGSWFNIFYFILKMDLTIQRSNISHLQMGSCWCALSSTGYTTIFTMSLVYFILTGAKIVILGCALTMTRKDISSMQFTRGSACLGSTRTLQLLPKQFFWLTLGRLCMPILVCILIEYTSKLFIV